MVFGETTNIAQVVECPRCKHSWRAVFILGSLGVECPNCKIMLKIEFLVVVKDEPIERMKDPDEARSVRALDAAEQGSEPTSEAIQAYMKEHNENYYNAREALRNKAYGGKPPHGFQSWGDYWKSY